MKLIYTDALGFVQQTGITEINFVFDVNGQELWVYDDDFADLPILKLQPKQVVSITKEN